MKSRPWLKQIGYVFTLLVAASVAYTLVILALMSGVVAIIFRGLESLFHSKALSDDLRHDIGWMMDKTVGIFYDASS